MHSYTARRFFEKKRQGIGQAKRQGLRIYIHTHTHTHTHTRKGTVATAAFVGATSDVLILEKIKKGKK